MHILCLTIQLGALTEGNYQNVRVKLRAKISHIGLHLTTTFEQCLYLTQKMAYDPEQPRIRCYKGVPTSFYFWYVRADVISWGTFVRDLFLGRSSRKVRDKLERRRFSEPCNATSLWLVVVIPLIRSILCHWLNQQTGNFPEKMPAKWIRHSPGPQDDPCAGYVRPYKINCAGYAKLNTSTMTMITITNRAAVKLQLIGALSNIPADAGHGVHRRWQYAVLSDIPFNGAVSVWCILDAHRLSYFQTRTSFITRITF